MVDAIISEQILREVQSLRSTVAVLQEALITHRRMVLRASINQPFLGQPVTINATVTSADGGRVHAGVPVLLTTIWGQLLADDGRGVQQGRSLTIYTDAFGSVSATLLPAVSEELWSEQQEALESLLAGLDSAAPTPRETLAGLQEMARHYRWEASRPFQQATDIYFRAFSGRLVETVNTRDYLEAWQYIDTTVFANIGAVDGSGTHSANQATAVLSIRFRDWLGPWLEVYQQLLADDGSQMANDLAAIKRRPGNVSYTLDSMYGRIEDFTTNIRGIVGNYAAQRVTQQVLRDVLNDSDELSVDRRKTLLPGLQAAYDGIATSGIDSLRVLKQTRIGVRQEVTTHLTNEASSVIDNLRDNVTHMGADVLAALQVDAAKLRGDNLTAFQTDIGKARGETFTGFQGDIGRLRNDAFTGFQTDIGKVRGQNITGFQTDIGRVRGETFTGFQTDIGRLRGDTITGLQTDVIKLRTDTFANLQSDSSKLRVDVLKELQTDSSKLHTDVVQNIQIDLDRLRRP
jgi:hypothetical protein